MLMEVEKDILYYALVYKKDREFIVRCVVSNRV